VLLMRRSILTEKVARRGYHLTREYSVDPFDLARVQDVMEREFPRISEDMSVADVASKMATDPVFASRQAVVLVDEQGALAGIVTRGDIVRAVGAGGAVGKTVAEIGARELIVTYPDQPLNTAIAQMLKEDIGRMPVVDPEQPKRVVGYLGRAAILSARMRFHGEEHVREKG